jgi:N-acetylmuramoyl-L-alanine amidase
VCAAAALVLVACGSSSASGPAVSASSGDAPAADAPSGTSDGADDGDAAAGPDEDLDPAEEVIDDEAAPSAPAGPPDGSDPEPSPAGRDEPTDDPTDDPTDEPTDEATDGPGPLAGRVIGLDPGHNGGNFEAPAEIARPVDAGGFTKPCNTTGTATADGYRESTFNLEVAEAVRDRLEALGAEVPLTREDDDGIGPCIDVRGTFGQTVGADLVLSIHADGAAVGARGFHVIVPVARDGTDPAIVAPSAGLGTAVRDALVDAGLTTSTYAGTDGIVERGDLATLNLSTVPVVLLEAGNLGDPQDAAELRDPAWQARLADALVAAVADHLGVDGVVDGAEADTPTG